MLLRQFFKKHFRLFLDRVRRNYQGQVAIFVAIVFQIIFVLFALMINVGLLIHHKINLQNSVDLAAYYGAMKQAEIMNVVGHVNFQIRQSWKLLTWRYRVLGTFGSEENRDPNTMAPVNPLGFVEFPIQNDGPGYKYNPNYTASCTYNGGTNNVNGKSPFNFPFMCLNHYGFADSASGSSNAETYCKYDCSHIANVPTQLPEIKGVPTTTSHTLGIINQINQSLKQAGDQIKDQCEKTGPISAVQLAKFYANYLADTKNKMNFIKTMMANLSLNPESMLDLDGNSISTGVDKTLRNNLTEANNSSLDSFEAFNSISSGDCSYNSINKVDAISGDPNVKLFAEVNFYFIQYFISRCKFNDTNPASKNYEFVPTSIYGPDGNLDPILKDQIKKAIGDDAAAAIENILAPRNYVHTLGIEKNPWCPVYFGVKAKTAPTIPFLPLSKVQLHATAFAKPFGGVIGPRAGQDWPADSQSSDTLETKATDKNLPMRSAPSGGTTVDLDKNRQMLLNYSNYVGDPLGLADPEYLAIYYDMLKNRTVGQDRSISPVSDNKTIEPNAGRNNTKPLVWPKYTNWNNVSVDIDQYDKFDPLAQDTENNKNSFMRDIEISVVAPNQFDITYYSIEPDFYNVYVKNKLENSFEKIKAGVGLSGQSIYIPKDFGNNNSLQGVTKNFSVRNQLEVVQRIIRSRTSDNNSGDPSLGPNHSKNMNMIFKKYFTFIPVKQGSLLTSWTMKDLVSDNFGAIETTDTTMPFARCDDEENLFDSGSSGSKGYGSISESTGSGSSSDTLPPAPGNCITGGRTGYSVKIVSPQTLYSEGDLTGGDSGRILNPPPEGFLSF